MQGLVFMVLWLGQGPVTVVENPAVLEAAKPVEKWLGRKLVVYPDARPRMMIETPVRFPLRFSTDFPLRFSTDEVLITTEVVYLGIEQFRTMRSGREVALFLSHPAAHVQLGHPEKARTFQAALRAALDMSDEVKNKMRDRWMESKEEEARPVAEKLFEATGCDEGKCEMFDKLLAAAK